MQTYKHKPIHFYDPHKAHLLDHYRCAGPLYYELQLIRVLQPQSSRYPLCNGLF